MQKRQIFGFGKYGFVCLFEGSRCRIIFSVSNSQRLINGNISEYFPLTVIPFNENTVGIFYLAQAEMQTIIDCAFKTAHRIGFDIKLFSLRKNGRLTADGARIFCAAD